MWFGLAILAAIFAALVAIFGKIGIKNIDSTLATTIRSIIMAVFLILASLATGRFSHLNSINSHSMKFIILSGISGAMSWLFYFSALKLGLASRVATVDRLSVVFVVILAALFLGESLTIKSIIGVSLLTLGAIVLVF